jgi:hypothetical protein
MKYKLCYIDDNWAYFTTQELVDQWGDDWNDAPYQSNAGDPYEYGDHDRKALKKPWRIYKLAWDSPELETPDGEWSVERINSGACAWLSTSRWVKRDKVVNVHAGASIQKFTKAVIASGGMVYRPIKERNEYQD